MCPCVPASSSSWTSSPPTFNSPLPMTNLQLAFKAPSHAHPLPSPLTHEAIPTQLPVTLPPPQAFLPTAPSLPHTLTPSGGNSSSTPAFTVQISALCLMRGRGPK